MERDDPWSQLVAETDFSDELVSERERYSLLVAAARAGVDEALIRRAIATEPDVVMATAAIVDGLHRTPVDQHGPWLELVRETYGGDVCRRRSAELAALDRAVQGRLSAADAEEAIDEWSSWLQWELSAKAGDPDVLAVVAARGSGRKVRAAADRRSAQLLGRPISKARTSELLDAICTELGHCLSPDDRGRLIEELPPDADTFTDAVLLARGIDPAACDRQARKALRRAIADALAGAPARRTKVARDEE